MCEFCTRHGEGKKWYLNSPALARVAIEPGRCCGCGVCRAACPSDAIALLPRETQPAAANLWH